jgi:hypothetical protein
MSVVRFEDAVKEIDTGSIIRLKYVTCDRKRKTGGEIREMDCVVTIPKEKRISAERAAKKTDRKQSHFENFTRNFYQCINGRPTMVIKKVHLVLVLELNGKKVML